MPLPALPDLAPPASAQDPEQELLAMAEQLLRLVRVAQALARSGRPVDFDGIQHPVGLLCAKALDLPPARAGFAKLDLIRLLAELDLLTTIMRENGR